MIYVHIIFCMVLAGIAYADVINNRVKIGIFENRPLSFFGESQEPRGIYPDMIREIARLEKWEITYIKDNWAGCLERLRKGEIDLMISIVYSKERDEIFDFSKEAVVTSWGQVYTHKDSDITRIVDLNGKDIAVMKNDITARDFMELCDKFNIKPEFKQFGVYDDVCRAIVEKKVAAGIINNLKGSILKGKYNIHPTSVMFSPFNTLFATPEGKNPHLLKAIDRHLSDWRRDENSIYYEILDNWYGNTKKTFQQNTQSIIISLFVLGGLGLFFLVWMNILRTQVKSRTLELEKSEEKHRKLVSNISDVIVILDKEGVIQYKSPNITEQFGWLPSDMIGRHGLFTVHPDDQERIRGNLEWILRNHRAQINVEYRYLCRDGSYKPVELAAVNMLDDPVVKGVLANYKDVTDRKKTENELRDSEEKYRSMMEAMDEPTYICTSDLKIEYLNPAMIKRLDRNATGEICHKAIHGLDERCSWCVHEVIMEGGYNSYEIVSPKDNRIYHITNSPIFHTDGSISKLSVFRDITEFKKIEGHLRQSQKMETIGTLAGGIAHDFNNMLFPIIGYTEMLLDDIPEGSPAESSLNEIFASAMRAKDLVKQILTFSRQDTSDLTVMKLQPIVEEALKLLRSTIPTTIEIIRDIDAGCGAVKAEPTQVHQIIMNLTTNAYHAMEKTGGKLKVSLKSLGIGKSDVMTPVMEPGRYVCLIIADTGEGMTRSVLKNAFDPFFSTKRRDRGTGMGLSVVHGIVTGMGGKLDVQSEPGAGTTIKAYFPEKKDIPKEAYSKDGEQIQTGTEHILLVDDEESIVIMESQMLERLGYQVTSHTSSLEALDAFCKTPDEFDLVITDMTMPNMPGDRLVAELKKVRSDIPVLLCTGFSEGMPKKAVADLGIDGVLLKPISMMDLSRQIRATMD